MGREGRGCPPPPPCCDKEGGRDRSVGVACCAGFHSVSPKFQGPMINPFFYLLHPRAHVMYVSAREP